MGHQEVSAHAGGAGGDAEAAAAAGDARGPGAARSGEREENLELVGLVSGRPYLHCGDVCNVPLLSLALEAFLRSLAASGKTYMGPPAGMAASSEQVWQGMRWRPAGLF